ncbi:hypothetical protein M407DRAFT_32361 [Tulasnella calospora MUT 4182]|uniref:Uncharacterized protein n=1 Tax=Tulasnella calospora MUT 4182 TaxID=1051891 RepID=A0A0C3Q436_9AGAM|nr:hypothetical protein M407DRAFT_32361 [Tulasnella calospora MUT 4182]
MAAILDESKNANRSSAAQVVLIIALVGVDSGRGNISLRWAVGGFGSGYGVLVNGFPTTDQYVGFLGKPVLISVDGETMMAYDPARVVDRTTRASGSFQFSSSHDIDCYNRLPALQPLQLQSRIPAYETHIEVTIIDPATNASLPVAQSGIVCLSNFVGWSVSRCHFTNVSKFPTSPLYILDLVVSVDAWKSLHEQEMACVMVVLTFVAFGMAWRNIMQVWEGLRPRRISELLATPLGVAGAAGAVRAVFPADSPLQTYWDESFYYPSILLLIWCAFVAILMTSDTAVKIHRRVSDWCHTCNGQHTMEKGGRQLTHGFSRGSPHASLRSLNGNIYPQVSSSTQRRGTQRADRETVPYLAGSTTDLVASQDPGRTGSQTPSQYGLEATELM